MAYEKLADATERLAAGLQARGIEHGDRVVIKTRNRVETLIALFGVTRIGAVFVLVDAKAPEVILANVVENCDAALVVVPEGDDDAPATVPSASFAELLDEPRSAAAASTMRPASSDLACLVYTSGSTGKPKGVMITHSNVLFTTHAINERLGLRQDDVIGCLLPLTFDYGLYQVFLAILVGATLTLASEADAGPGMASFVPDGGVTVLPLVPAMVPPLLRLIERSQQPPINVRMITSTGERLGQKLLERVQLAFPSAEIYSMYGLTECKRISILLSEELEERPASVGRVLSGTKYAVVDPTSGREVPAGEIGELIVTGPHVTAGYWGDPALTSRRFKSWGPFNERYLFTGDLVSGDAEGFLCFAGREDDIVKVNGMRVSLNEIEMVASEVPGVQQSVAVQGHQGELCLLAVTDLESHALREALAERLESFKLPDVIERCEELPLNGNGKIDRTAVVQELI
jgi:amino acid adenylation domain-containing protein